MILVLGFVFRQVHLEPGEMHLAHDVNLVLADVSVVLLCLILMLGPLARLVPRMRSLIPWGRELGIGVFVTAGLHLVILLDGWDILGFFYDDAITSVSRRLVMDWGAAANWVGLLALIYALVLAATSNDWSHRKLGRGWKFLQRQTYTLFVLTWLHAAGLFLVWSIPFWFWALTALAVAAQFVGFIHTVRATRGPSPQRPPPKPGRTDASKGLSRIGRWAVVALLWGGLSIGSLAIAAVEVDEMAAFCDRYEKVQDLPRTEMILDLMDYVPDSDQIVPIPQLIEDC